ncbi:MAG: PBSX family phage terminase large subunit [Eubacteriales bacterium]|nr:PBSX family phage terminase large subunit [Eubacteriales bacterium]
MTDIQLSKLIAPAFLPVHADLRRGGHDEYWLMGGRGSCKSSFASIEIARGIMRAPQANAIIYRKVADTLRDSVYAQMVWALDQLGVLPWWQCKISPMELVYKPTGQRVIFRGADDPQKSKGIKLKSGYFRYLWFEELTEFAGMEDVRTIKASVIRGGEAVTLYTYNPPMSAANWVNKEALARPEGRLTHQSSYLQVPPEWLGRSFMANAEALKAANERAYRHMYLGEVTGTGGQVFDNLKLRAIKPEEWQGLHTYSGLDFGFATDPDTYVRCAYSRKRRRLYIVNEFAATGQLLDALGKQLTGRCGRDVITADNEDPRSISQLRAHGVRVIAAKKGKDSVDHGMKWLQTLAEIVIDPSKCPFSAKEFAAYEYDRDKSGNVLPRYPDKNNHSIDATRYAMESVSAQKSAIVPK